MKPPKCLYCGNPAFPGYPIEEKDCAQYVCCSTACKQRAEAFLRYSNRTQYWFLALIFLAIALLSISAFAATRVLTATGVAVIGISLVVFPFSTPQTVGWIGIRKSVLMVRTLGVVTLLGSLLVWFFL